MQILSLELEDVKSYANARVDFRRGVNAIVGTNGAGKSTILEAIGFALFDHLGYKQQDFVREGKSSGTVSVTFLSSLDDRQYLVVRKFGSSNQHYIFDPELDAKVCEGKADVLAFLREHMGVEPGADLARLFSDAVGVPQGTFTAAFLLTPTQRKSTFDPLLQVDEYKKAFDGLREPLSTLKARGQALAVELAGLSARLEQLPELEAAVAQRAEELAASARTLDELTGQLGAVEKTRAELEARQQEVRTLQQERSALHERQNSLANRLDAAERTLAEAQAAAAKLAENQAGHDAYIAAQAEQRTLDAQVRTRQTQRDQLSRADKALSLTRREIEQTEAAAAAVVDAEATVVRLTPAVAEQKRLEERLEAARRDLSRRQDLTTQIARAAAEVEQLQTRLAEMTAQLEQGAQYAAEQSRLEATIATDQRALNELRDALAAMRAEADVVKEQTAALEAGDSALCPVCEQELTDGHRAAMLARNGTRLDAMRTRYGGLQQRIKHDSTALEGAQARLKTIQQARLKLPRSGEQESVCQELAKRTEALAEQRLRLAESDDIPQQIETLTRELAALANPREQSAVAAAQAARRAEIEQQRAALAEAVATQAAAVAELTAALAEFADLDAKLADNQRALTENSAAYQAVLSLRQLAESVARHAAEAAEVKQAQAELHETVSDLTAKLDKAEAAFDSEEYAAMVVEAQRLRSEQASLQTRRTMLAEEQVRGETALARLRAVEQQVSEVKTQQKAYARQEEVLEAMRAVLREAGPYITATLIRQVSEDAARIFYELMEDHARHLTWGEDYNIVLNVDGNDRHFSQLSGGEQMSAALSVRLALLREMSSIDIAFFDEPTTNLDEQRREALAQQILNVRGLTQLFVISHDDTFEQATQNLIRVARDGGQSRIVAAE